MVNIFGEYHIIRNFPKNYPLFRKVFDNFVFFFSGTILHPRKNLLTHHDIERARHTLRKGDIVIAGNLRTVLASFIREPVTHSTIYVGKRKFIHAIGDGVCYLSLHHLFTNYDTLAVLRLPKMKNKRSIIKKAIKYAKDQLGKPYDFEFKKGKQFFFCTELVNESFHHAGYHTGLSNFKKPKDFVKELEEKLSKAADALHPMDFVRGNFEVVFLSHNLGLKNKKLAFLKD